jgi:peptide-methionine (S)-S-oxide reductase
MTRISLAFVLAGLLALLPAGRAGAAPRQHVVLAGGCFWGMQAVFESLRGVTSAVAGYSGGSAATARYEMVSTGTTGHAESVDVTYDPAEISFKQILSVYFLVAHDPTELDYQGPDDGTQYRSEVFYTTQAQRNEAQAFIANLTRRHVFAKPIVTQLAPLRGFYRAEAYHQNFLVHNPGNPYIVINDIPKLRALEANFPRLVNDDAAPIRVAGR